MRIDLRTCLVVLSLAFLATGCAKSGPIPVAVTGKITLDGKPMTDGIIYYQLPGQVPIPSKILDGRYSIQALPGEYHVAIQQERDSGTKNMYGEPQMISTVAPRFNTDSTLKATVTPDGPNGFDFAVESR